MTDFKTIKLPAETQIRGIPAQWEIFYWGTNLDGTGPWAWCIADTATTEEDAEQKAIALAQQLQVKTAYQMKTKHERTPEEIQKDAAAIQRLKDARAFRDEKRAYARSLRD